MTAIVLRGDARALPLPDESVDLIVTSPPYFGLRSYQDGGEHYDGQIGAEATPGEYLAALWVCTREWMRVLKPTGSLWVNLGDNYADKSLMGMPWRYVLGCMDGLGLTLRAEVIWHKTNAMPERATDRVHRVHEHWFHLTKQACYFAAVDEIREPYASSSVARSHLTHRGGATDAKRVATGDKSTPYKPTAFAASPFGKRPGSVWEIATQPLRVPVGLEADHFAAFPLELPRRIISGWSPEGGVVVDPFGGTGTTALMADVLGRRGVSVDMSADYCRLAMWRTTDRGERARALGLPKPQPIPEGMDSLFDLEAS